MRNMRKLLSLLLALVMVFSLAVTAFADEATGETEAPAETTYTITIPAGDAHNYAIYQIFTGDLHEGVLSNIKWGANGTGEAEELVSEDVLNAVKAASGSNAEKLAVILEYVDLSTPFQTVIGSATEDINVEVAPGYYLLKDASIGTDDAYTTFIVLVVEDVTIARKAAKPGIDKQVWDEADDAETAGQNWGETADHELNETFQFKLIATLTGDKDYADYETYKLIFHDSMSKGVTYLGNETVTVVSGGTEIELTEDQYDVAYATNADTGITTLTITVTDMQSIEGVDLSQDTTVTVIYDAKLNEQAVIGNIDENLNDVYLEYSNNPNWEWSYDEEGNPKNPGDDGKDNDNDGEEDEDDEKDEPTGKTEKDTVWVFTYEVKVNKIDGNTQEELPDAEFQMKNADGKWLVVDENGKVQQWIDDQSKASVLKSDENGVFSVIGLDHGTYYLVETKAPNGYNLLTEEVEVNVVATHKEETAESAKTEFTVNEKSEITVENKAGIVLPETGGMGTTMIYILGAVMVLGAGILLVTKRRMAM